MAGSSLSPCGPLPHSPASQPARARCVVRAGQPAVKPVEVVSMKKPSKHTLKMKLRKSRKDTQIANESVALFLGPKLLGELRILMRLASPPALR